ncbi:MAG: hypothetical protein QOI95_1171 [Acidimicrobiaceae bacterium]|jgi:hypothetical protein
MVSGMTTTGERNDLTMAMAIAVAAIVLGSFLPWSHLLVTARGTEGAGNLTLLLGGITGALLARWRLDGCVRRGALTTSLVLCAATSAVLLYEVVHVARIAQPLNGLFLATAGAVSATVLSAALLQRTRYATV